MRIRTGLFLLCLGGYTGDLLADVVTTVPIEVTTGVSSAEAETIELSLEVEPLFEVNWNENWQFNSSFRLWFDLENELTAGQPDFDTYSPASRPLAIGDTGIAEIRDFNVSYRWSRGRLTLGKQQVIWGKLDGLKVLDVVNPQNFREFILDDFDNSRIGLWSAVLDVSFGNWRSEFVFAPDGTGHELPPGNAWFAFQAPRFRFGSQTTTATAPIDTVSPGNGLSDTAFGLRLSRQFGPWDVSLVGYSGNDFEPIGQLSSTGGNLQRSLERRHVYGFSLANSFGPIAFRGEYGFQPNRTFNRLGDAGLTTVELDQHSAAVAFDISAPGEVFINLQYLLDTIPEQIDDLVRPRTDRIATLFLRRSFNYERLTVQAKWYHSFRQNDDIISVSLSFDLSDNTRLKILSDTFVGNESGVFGQFDGRDRMMLSIEHTL